ncbi:MAG: hypothetical protein ABEL76_14250 [Bradymonadaceae bacterium]
MTDTIEDVAHVVPAVAADGVRELGGREIVEFPDVLSHGPASTDPETHGELRSNYWRGLYERTFGADGAVDPDEALGDLEEGYLTAQQLASVIERYADDRRVLFWTTPTFRDRLFLWLAFHAVERVDVGADRVATAEPRIALGDGDEGWVPLRDLGASELQAGFDDLFYPEAIYVQTGAQLWETYASGSPREFALSVGHTRKFFPRIEEFAEDYGRLFPVAQSPEGGPISPSALDERLLESLETDEWVRPEEVVDRRFLEEYSFLDEIAVVARLVEWSNAGEGAYVEGRPRSDGETSLWNWAFRLGDRGGDLLESGLETGDDVPVWWQGDVRIYAGDSPWVKVIDDEHWWFERVDLPESGE